MVRRWQIVGKSSLARPAPWNAGLHFFYTECLKGIPMHRAYLSKVPHLFFLWG